MGVNRPSAVATRFTTWSKSRGRAARRNAFNFANASSIGLKSGLYGQEAQLRAGLFDRRAHRGVLVHHQVIGDDDVTRAQCGHQDLIDIGLETDRVDRAVKHRGRTQAVETRAAITVCVSQ